MHTTRFALLAVPTLLLFTACESTGPRTMQRVSLSTVVGTRPASAGLAADVIVSGSGGTVTITSAQIVLSDLRLEGGGTCAGIAADDRDGHDSAEVDDDSMEVHDSADVADSDDVHDTPDTTEHDGDNNDEHDCEPLNVGPVTVNLPLDGTTKVALDGLVPAGTYSGLRAKIEGVNVMGTFTDSGGTAHAFTFTSSAEGEVEMNFPAPVTVGTGTNNLTIDVNVAAWFTDATGVVIDPTNPANQEAIEHAIRASFRAFEDDNHDGSDDHEDH